MKRLLVALDTSDNSTFVLARAIELAKSLGAKVRLLSAVQMPPVIAGPYPLYVDPGGVINEAEATLREREREVPPALRDGIVVRMGIVCDVVCSAALSYDADLVVIGAHRHGLLARLLGTTAAAIANKIDRPLIVVRPTPTTIAAHAPAPVRADVSGPNGVPKHKPHTLLEAAGLTGAVSGAAVGMIAGPPGAVLGGIVGGGIGMLAGQVLDKEASRTGAHDRTLDDDIGVTRGDLGARESAVAGLNAIEHARRLGSEVVERGGAVRAGDILRRDHERLERIYDALVSAYRSGDWEQVQAQWSVFEPAIVMHMDTEEQDVFPELRLVDREEAEALLADHTELRRLLGALGVAIDLHSVPAADALELIARLRAHGAREEILLYPWMDRALDITKLRRLAPAA